MPNHTNEHASDRNRSVIEIDLENAYDGSQYANVELSEQPPRDSSRSPRLDPRSGPWLWVARFSGFGILLAAQSSAASHNNQWRLLSLFRKKYGMDFWRHEPGAIVVVALKNTLKCSGLGYGRLPSPIGGRPIADFMTTKALELNGERRFLLRLNHALILMSHALRFQTQPGTGRLLPKAATAGEWIPLAGHSPAS